MCWRSSQTERTSALHYITQHFSCQHPVVVNKPRWHLDVRYLEIKVKYYNSFPHFKFKLWWCTATKKKNTVQVFMDLAILYMTFKSLCLICILGLSPRLFLTHKRPTFLGMPFQFQELLKKYPLHPLLFLLHYCHFFVLLFWSSWFESC